MRKSIVLVAGLGVASLLCVSIFAGRRCRQPGES